MHFAPNSWKFNSKAPGEAYDCLVQGGAIKIYYQNANGEEKSWTAMISQSERISEEKKTVKDIVRVECKPASPQPIPDKPNSPSDDEVEIVN